MGSTYLFSFFRKIVIMDVTFPAQNLLYRVRREITEVSPVTDIQIIRLYWDRDEQAIHETDLRYGSRLHYLAHKIVQDFEDAQECVNDT